MVKRKIVEIDEEKCNGCGECVPACDEGAIKIEDGVAKLKEERLCDGLGDCLGECPKDAINIVEREADEFDEEAVREELKSMGRDPSEFESGHGSHAHAGGGCPGARMRNMAAEGAAEGKDAGEESGRESGRDGSGSAGSSEAKAVSSGDVSISINSQLEQWPVQLNLLPETAPFFQGADLLVAADCVPFAYADFHLDLLQDKKVVVGCPKLDNLDNYRHKLKGIIENNDLNSISVAIMEVPCCRGMARAVHEAAAAAGSDIEVEEIIITVDGERK